MRLSMRNLCPLGGNRGGRLCVFLTVLGCLGFASTTHAENLLNPDFDVDVAPWTAGLGTITWDSLDIDGSTFSGSMKIDTGSSGASVVSECLAVDPLQSYHIEGSFFVPAGQSGGLLLSLIWYATPSCDSAIFSVGTNNIIPTFDAWFEKSPSAALTPPAGAQSYRLFIRTFSSTADPLTVYADDLAVVPSSLPDCSDIAPELAAVGSRYLEATLWNCAGDFAIQVLGEGSVSCVKLYVQPDGRLAPVPYFQSFEEWGERVYVRGAEIIPSATYKARFEAPNGLVGPDSASATTWRYGETDGDQGPFPNSSDILCALQGPTGTFTPPCSLYSADVTGGDCCVPDRRGTDNDVEAVLDAFSGAEFPCAGPCCLVVEDFEGGAHGWRTDPGSDCLTGQFVLGTPTLMESSGVTTQPDGDHTWQTGNALLTAFNTTPGSDDVDGGTCIVESPEYEVSSDSDVSVWFFHGQRDAGDDPNDAFALEISTDNGVSWGLMETAPGVAAAFGDETINAIWTRARSTAPAGSLVRIRVRVTDGAGPGDIIEAGLDDLVICPSN